MLPLLLDHLFTKVFFLIHEWNSLPLHILITPDTPNFKHQAVYCFGDSRILL